LGGRSHHGKIKTLVARTLMGQSRIVGFANDPAGSGARQMDIPAAIDDFYE
jgi:hypothetical protein